MADKVRKKIAMYQSKEEYCSLHIMITNNPRYWKDRLTTDSVDEALKKIRTWLVKNL